MPRYIDADKFVNIINSLNTVQGSLSAVYITDVIQALYTVPTADVQEVVRCKNCRFFDKYDKVEDFDGQCVVRDCETDKEEFCSYGSKRDDEK